MMSVLSFITEGVKQTTRSRLESIYIHHNKIQSLHSTVHNFEQLCNMFELVSNYPQSIDNIRNSTPNDTWSNISLWHEWCLDQVFSAEQTGQKTRNNRHMLYPTKLSINGEVDDQIYSILGKLGSRDRLRLVQSVDTLLGEYVPRVLETLKVSQVYNHVRGTTTRSVLKLFQYVFEHVIENMSCQKMTNSLQMDKKVSVVMDCVFGSGFDKYNLEGEGQMQETDNFVHNLFCLIIIVFNILDTSYLTDSKITAYMIGSGVHLLSLKLGNDKTKTLVCTDYDITLLDRGRQISTEDETYETKYMNRLYAEQMLSGEEEMFASSSLEMANKLIGDTDVSSLSVCRKILGVMYTSYNTQTDHAPYKINKVGNTKYTTVERIWLPFDIDKLLGNNYVSPILLASLATIRSLTLGQVYFGHLHHPGRGGVIFPEVGIIPLSERDEYLFFRDSFLFCYDTGDIVVANELNGGKLDSTYISSQSRDSVWTDVCSTYLLPLLDVRCFLASVEHEDTLPERLSFVEHRIFVGANVYDPLYTKRQDAKQVSISPLPRDTYIFASLPPSTVRNEWKHEDDKVMLLDEVMRNNRNCVTLMSTEQYSLQTDVVISWDNDPPVSLSTRAMAFVLECDIYYLLAINSSQDVMLRHFIQRNTNVLKSVYVQLSQAYKLHCTCGNCSDQSCLDAIVSKHLYLTPTAQDTVTNVVEEVAKVQWK